MYLDARHLTKKFPGVQALSDVDIDLREGEVHAIVGENGAGKSTLMNILVGLIRPDRGEIFVHGEKVVFYNPIDAQRKGIAIVPQEINLVPMLSVMENIYLGIEPRSAAGLLVDWRKTEKEARRLIERMEEAIDPREKVATLTTAQRQLVQIARAFAFNSKVLILDEPTASLTIRETDNLFRILRSFTSSGGAAFYISHRLEEIQEIANRISVMRDGRKVTELDTATSSISEMITHMVKKKVEKITPVRANGTRVEKTLLKVENLTRAGEFHDVSFELRAGEILGIAGLVGAGRTELVKCIFGDTLPQSGVIYVDSKKVVHKNPGNAIVNGIAYLPEERRRLGVFPLLSVRENITLQKLGEITTWFGIAKRKEKTLAGEYVAKLNIKAKDLSVAISTLSGGNQQKVILSRWLLKNSRILILDEPTRGIDVNAKTEIYNILRDLANQGMGIILISSELEEVIENADRILVLHEGRLVGEVNPAETSQEEILEICLI